MLQKFTPDLFEPIHLPRIKWRQMTQPMSRHAATAWPLPQLGANDQHGRRFQISSGYRACRWMQDLVRPANEN